MAAIYGFVVGTFVYRDLKLKDLPQLLMNSGKGTAMVMIIVGAASSFGWILTSARIPDVIAAFMVSLTDSPFGILLVINIFLLIVGCLMDVTAAIIILTPIFLPIISQFGIDPIHFGIIMTLALAIAFVTPPVALNLFVGSSMTGLSIDKIVKAFMPFLIGLIVAFFIVSFVPAISLGVLGDWSLTFG